jgi:hypothetical protein
MSKAKKLILGVFALGLLLAATPVSAQLIGAWEGEGSGFCYPHPGTVIYPWNEWEGEVYISPDQDAPIFEGEWWDAMDNWGTFKGNVLSISPTENQRICIGEWTWYDPNGTSAEPVYGGTFRMVFYLKEGVCQGTWKTIWPTPYKVGTMKGEKID